MKHSTLNKDQRKQWQKMLVATLNGCNVVYKQDLKDWSKRYNALMQEKVKLLEKYSKISENTK